MDKAKWIVVILIALATLGLIVGGCTYKGQAHDPMMAKIRYFDGSLDTIYITSYRVNAGAVTFTSIDGVVTTTGANNVIIIKGDTGNE